MPNILSEIAAIDAHIAILRETLHELVEQAAAESGAAADDLISQRIATQQEKLDLLTKQREELSRQQS